MNFRPAQDRVRPVYLASGYIQSQTPWITQSGGDEVFDLGPIEVCPLNFRPAPHDHVRPVYLAPGHIQGEVRRFQQPSGDEVFYL